MKLMHLVLVAALAAASCKSESAPADPPPPAVVRDGGVTVRARVRLPVQARGLSGLARDGVGDLWSTPERGRSLVHLEQEGTSFSLVGRVRITGLPSGWDTESMAWIGPDLIAFGTETQETRDTDYVVIAQIAGDGAQVVEKIPMPYAPWGIEARVNRGIEGLCHADGSIVAGNENVIEQGGARWAPLARYDLTRRTWETFRLRLVSKAGKISAVACRPSADVERIDVLAIERHYGIARLLRFGIPRTGPGGDIVATEVADLAKRVAGVPNMEGLDWRGDEVVIFVDNDTGGVTGPCEAIVLTLDD